MLPVDWVVYASLQIRWAESLLIKANRIDEARSADLYAESAETLANISELIKLLTDAEIDGSSLS